MSSDTSQPELHVLVMAKAPVAGFAKTRLALDVGSSAAARLAAAALVDTMDVVAAATGPGRRMMAVAGDLGVAERGHEISRRLASWHVVRQRGSALGERLACAQRSARSRWGDRALVVQIGMDTPQLEAHDLRVLETSSVEPDGTVVCALGPAPDGGWWGLATRHAGAADHLVGVPMSRADTCQRTAATLRAAGSRVVHVHQLRDVDTIEDAMAVAAEHPRLRFSRELGHVLGEARLQSPSSPVREKVANA